LYDLCSMNIGVVVFPGSNCDHDLLEALSLVPSAKVQELWHNDSNLKNSDLVFLPGGFSYGDYLRSGAIAKLSPVMKAVKQHAQDGGFVMGICNGFQILCEAGLLPGALLRNTNRKFICKNVFLKAESNDFVITKLLDTQKAYSIPIAHGEGNYHCDAETLQTLKDNNQIVFRYCDENGKLTQQSNPNGSLENIAGICNESKNVFGMMPHPERAASDFLFNTDGRLILDSLAKGEKGKA
jgi:phosphoribosylformylglycinamidine synthase subunit PurQ / glutaminase